MQIGNLTRNAIEEQLKKSGLKARALQKAKPTTTNNINISINIIAPTQGGTAIVNQKEPTLFTKVRDIDGTRNRGHRYVSHTFESNSKSQHQRFNELMSFDWNEKIKKMSAEIEHVRRRPTAVNVNSERKHVKFNIPE